jgi:sterol desaturase/sphingolipid hydroxylase (fatty acid hydroxylase superfamily)
MGFPDPVRLAIPFFIVTLLAELLIGRRGRARHSWPDTGTSLAMGIGSLVAGAATAGLLAMITALAWQHRLATLPVTLLTGLVCFVADDLAYYLFHRSAHRVRWFWASHVVHHSSVHYNLSTALRQTWTGFFSLSFMFRLPLIVAGFPPELVLFCAGVNLVYQYWIHTELVGRMPRWFEAVMNTPSHHRVHHGTNPRYLDRNYAGVFIIWDRLLGTFTPEIADDPPRYGLVKPVGSFNPLWVAVHEWVAIAQDVVKARSLRAVWTAIAGAPGAASGETSAVLRARAGLPP